MQSRDSDLDKFFAHEIQPFPLLSPIWENFAFQATSPIYWIVFNLHPHQSHHQHMIAKSWIVVHSLPTNAVRTFNEYANRLFIPYLENQLQNTSRIDVVWDDYRADSLKESTREKRGTGMRKKVTEEAKLRLKWMDFLRDPKNKTELFAFLILKIAEFTWPAGKCVHATSGNTVVSLDCSTPMGDCNHEEANTRIVVHVAHAFQQGAKTVQIQTVDTDVIVIMIGVLHKLLTSYEVADIWIAFGMGKHLRFYHINDIYAAMGERKSKALPFSHAFSGCDTTSAFFGKGKKTAWQAWGAYTDATEAMAHLAENPFHHLEEDSECFSVIERLVIVLYDKTSNLSSINDARKILFCHMNRAMDKLPPTRNCLLEHARRAIYQTGIWAMSTKPQIDVPSPQNFSWRKMGGLLGTCMDDNPRSLQSMPRACEMFLKRIMFSMQMRQSKS